MTTKQPEKKTTEAMPTEAPAKGKKIKADARRLDKKGGGEPKNATGT
jgi:hypothetical protein